MDIVLTFLEVHVEAVVILASMAAAAMLAGVMDLLGIDFSPVRFSRAFGRYLRRLCRMTLLRSGVTCLARGTHRKAQRNRLGGFCCTDCGHFGADYEDMGYDIGSSHVSPLRRSYDRKTGSVTRSGWEGAA